MHSVDRALTHQKLDHLGLDRSAKQQNQRPLRKVPGLIVSPPSPGVILTETERTPPFQSPSLVTYIHHLQVCHGTRFHFLYSACSPRNSLARRPPLNLVGTRS